MTTDEIRAAATLDNIAWDEAKKRLGPGATFSEIAKLAQQIKTLALDPPDPEGSWRDVLIGWIVFCILWGAILVAIYELSKAAH
jgi:hypothetical protein